MSNKSTFKIVPVEPTEEQLTCALKAPVPGGSEVSAWFIPGASKETIKELLTIAHKVMLQASPPAPSVDEIKQFILEAGQEIEFASRAHALLAQFEAMEKDDG